MQTSILGRMNVLFRSSSETDVLLVLYLCFGSTEAHRYITYGDLHNINGPITDTVVKVFGRDSANDRPKFGHIG